MSALRGQSCDKAVGILPTDQPFALLFLSGNLGAQQNSASQSRNRSVRANVEPLNS
jgi:hypothetical protein